MGTASPSKLSMPLIAQATETFTRLIGHKSSGVVGITQVDDGWKLEIEVVEKESIPASQDILGLYEVRLNPRGEVVQFRRVKLRRRSDPGTN